MKPDGNVPFDPKVFLAKVGEGRTLADYQENQVVFAQGDPADAIFYIQDGKVKLTVVSKQGKEAVIAIVGNGDFFGEGCLAGRGYVLVHDRAAGEAGHDPGAARRANLFSVVPRLHAFPQHSS